MCGIVAYIGKNQACPIVIKGLQRLEYRGYDSAGIALMQEGDITVYKTKGKVSDLQSFIEGKPTDSTLGMGHTRWATHGVPNDVNAHPHYSGNKNIAIIHNGIIENYAVIKEELTKRGHVFHSDTDTEVLVHLIEEIQNNEKCSLEKALLEALNEVTGAYAIVVMERNDPNTLYGARKGSPLVLGIGTDEYFLASDATPIVEYTKNVVYIGEEEVVVIKRDGGFTLKTIQNVEKTPYIQELELKLEMLEKGGYEHFMLKEIHEQPRSIKDSMRGRLNAVDNTIKLGGLKEYEHKIINANRILIVACGTSWHAGLVAEYLFEDLARIPVEVEYASEFRYRNPVINENDVVIAISQSGETADSLAAIKLAKEKGATIIGICNVVGSSIPRETHAGSYTHAGPEIGVASTKAFTAQVVVLTMMAIYVAYKRGKITESKYRQLIIELDTIPDKVKHIIDSTNEQVKKIAEIYKNAHNFLYLGRGYNFPVALEGALKLKEISYIHAEGYPAAEMKHGPIALIDENMPVVVVATNHSAYEKIISNVQEVVARKGRVIAIVTKADDIIKSLAEHVIEIPDTEESFSPLLSVIPLQLLSYYIAVGLGKNVDQPRNLAKSVTVE
jgi:glucosamine--fructose-6-phosphate aminotransferase (isomerizing)